MVRAVAFVAPNSLPSLFEQSHEMPRALPHETWPFILFQTAMTALATSRGAHNLVRCLHGRLGPPRPRQGGLFRVERREGHAASASPKLYLQTLQLCVRTPNLAKLPRPLANAATG